MSIVDIIEGARSRGRGVLTEVESKQVLAEAGIPVAPARLAGTAEEAAKAALEIGLPVVLKVVSPHIIHKSDVASPSEVTAAFQEVMAAVRRHQPEASIEGVSVQPMAKPGIEVIMGMTKDPQFGPVLMFGLGGILVEVLKDVAFRIVPLAPRDARQIKGYPVLEGFRGQPPADVGALENILLRLSDFAESHPEIQELDLNPIFAYPQGALAVDARIVVS